MGRAGLNPESASAAMAPQLTAAQATEPSVAEQPFATRGQPLGLDVSSWQGSVDWSSVGANGARFAYVKATEGTSYRNSEFGAQYTGASSVGLLRGAYHFGRPDVSDGATQARFFVNNGGGWSADGVTMPPVLDIEDNPYAGLNRCYGASPAQLATWVRDFTQTVYSMTNKQAMIYTSYYFWRDCLGNTSEFSQTNPLWLASYYTNSPAIPGGWPTYSVWQYANAFADASQTVRATFPGDQNVFNGSLDQLRKLASTPDYRPLAAPDGAYTFSGKWNGNGKSYVGWMLDGRWCLQNTAGDASCFNYGGPGDRPAIGDWDGNGTDSIGIVRSGRWYLSNSPGGPSIDYVATFGDPSDTAIAGDWNGDGKAGIGIFRNGQWALSNIIQGPAPVSNIVNFGQSGDQPLTGDWDGDGKTSVGIFRGNVFALNNTINSSQVSNSGMFGDAGDRAIVGDWDGNKTTTMGLVRYQQYFLTNNNSTRTIDIAVR